MAKTTSRKPEKEAPKKKYPSQFGSHESMIDCEATKALEDPNLVVLVDENGPYTTELKRLDDRLADPNRYRESRLKFV